MSIIYDDSISDVGFQPWLWAAAPFIGVAIGAGIVGLIWWASRW